MIFTPLWLILAFLLLPIGASGLTSDNRRTYIVHTMHSGMPAVFHSPRDWYKSTLASVSPLLSAEEIDQSSLIYTYQAASQGFAARLTEEQAASLEKVHGFLSVVPDKLFKLQTTYTPEFMGLNRHGGLWPAASYGDDVIVGVLDTGIWPESKSFDDEGMGPVPTRWKGACVGGADFDRTLCNRKLIGAKYFLSTLNDGLGQAQPPNGTLTEFKSPRDVQGHGTHTASTATGATVSNASFFGYANGTAKGVAFKARLAVYKVCWASIGGCLGADLLAAIDEAVSDGVDVISISLGGEASPFFQDPIAVGAFGAVADHGIVVTCAAGNEGPTPGSVINTAPWLLTVAASTVDRDFPATVRLGNGAAYVGQSLYTGKALGSQQRTLVASGLCEEGSLDIQDVEGKIVVCQQGNNVRRHSAASVVAAAGGAGEIFVQRTDMGRSVVASSFLLPGVGVRADDGAVIQKYAAGRSSRATATMFFNGTEFGRQRGPSVASFSSRGPNSVVPGILKPDLTTPGVSILAAWSDVAPPTIDPADSRKTPFNIISGTSMSCPHAAGLVALLHAAHPSWSGAAMKSALMTTARSSDSRDQPILDDYDGKAATPFHYGAGQVDPNAALDPGLVYDMSAQDYVDFLCGLDYTDRELLVFTRGRRTCSGQVVSASELNYPSLTVVFNATSAGSGITLRRTVTNVGAASAMYKAKVTEPRGTAVKVVPGKLSFSAVGEKLGFEVVIMSTRRGSSHAEELLNSNAFGLLTWVDANKAHEVRSPIVVTWGAA